MKAAAGRKAQEVSCSQSVAEIGEEEQKVCKQQTSTTSMSNSMEAVEEEMLQDNKKQQLQQEKLELISNGSSGVPNNINRGDVGVSSDNRRRTKRIICEGCSFKRATLRKQTSSQALDSCASSDSGRATCCHSSGSLAGCPSLASVRGAGNSSAGSSSAAISVGGQVGGSSQAVGELVNTEGSSSPASSTSSSTSRSSRSSSTSCSSPASASASSSTTSTSASSKNCSPASCNITGSSSSSIGSGFNSSRSSAGSGQLFSASLGAAEAASRQATRQTNKQMLADRCQREPQTSSAEITSLNHLYHHHHHHHHHFKQQHSAEDFLKGPQTSTTTTTMNQSLWSGRRQSWLMSLGRSECSVGEQQCRRPSAHLPPLATTSRRALLNRFESSQEEEEEEEDAEAGADCTGAVSGFSHDVDDDDHEDACDDDEDLAPDNEPRPLWAETSSSQWPQPTAESVGERARKDQSNLADGWQASSYYREGERGNDYRMVAAKKADSNSPLPSQTKSHQNGGSANGNGARNAKRDSLHSPAANGLLEALYSSEGGPGLETVCGGGHGFTAFVDMGFASDAMRDASAASRTNQECVEEEYQQKEEQEQEKGLEFGLQEQAKESYSFDGCSVSAPIVAATSSSIGDGDKSPGKVDQQTATTERKGEAWEMKRWKKINKKDSHASSSSSTTNNNNNNQKNNIQHKQQDEQLQPREKEDELEQRTQMIGRLQLPAGNPCSLLLELPALGGPLGAQAKRMQDRAGSTLPSSEQNKLVICGKIKTLQYLALPASERHEEDNENHGEGPRKRRQYSVGRLLVCLDINEPEKRHLIESKLIRPGEFELLESKSPAAAAAAANERRHSLGYPNSSPANQPPDRSAPLDKSLIIASSRARELPPELRSWRRRRKREEQQEERENCSGGERRDSRDTNSLPELDTDWLLESKSRLSRSQVNSPTSSEVSFSSSSSSQFPYRELFTDMRRGRRRPSKQSGKLAASQDLPPLDSSAASESGSSSSSPPSSVSGERRKTRRKVAKLDGRHFWRLVASSTTTTTATTTSDDQESGEESDDLAGRQPNSHNDRHASLHKCRLPAAVEHCHEEGLHGSSSAGHQRDHNHCSLARLIQASDYDLNQRPRLLLLERGLCFPSSQQDPNREQKQESEHHHDLHRASSPLSSWSQMSQPQQQHAQRSGQLNNASSTTAPAPVTTTTTTTTTTMATASSSANNNNNPRLNSIDEEEVCLSQQLDLESGSEFNSSLASSSSASSSMIARAAGETICVVEPMTRAPGNACGRQLVEKGVTAGASGRSKFAQGLNAASEIRIDVGASSINEPQQQDEFAKEVAEEEMEEPEGLKHDCDNDNDERDEDHDDDDDYFYDDELLFEPGSRQQRGSLYSNHSRRSSGAEQLQARCSATSSNVSFSSADDKKRLNEDARPSAESLLARLRGSSDVAGSRPLIVWAPSVRRVSCPVGNQLAAFSSWRQLWPALPPLQAAAGANSTGSGGCGFVCSHCLRMVSQQEAGVAGAAEITPSHQANNNMSNLNGSSSQRARSPARACSPYNCATANQQQQATKISQQSLLTCSDYFSSFDQTTSCDQAFVAGQQISSMLSVASSVSRCSATQNNQRHRNRASLAGLTCPASSASISVASSSGQTAAGPLAGATQLELRRQSTITGFDHQRYTAPRSPSLCLPTPPPLSSRRQNPAFGRRIQQTSHNQLNPNQLGPHSSRRLSPSHSTGGSSSPSPTNWAQLNQISQQAACPMSMSQRRAGGARFGRARLESLDSDRGSSPCSWSASTSSLRSSIGAASSIYSVNLLAGLIQANGNKANQRKLSGCVCCECSQSSPTAASLQNQANQKHSKLAARLSAKLGNHSHLSLSAAASSQQHQQQLQQIQQEQSLQLQQQQQQQAVYFFFCCCQRKNQQQSQRSSINEASEEPQQQLMPVAEPSRRVSLVVGPAIVSGGDSWPAHQAPATSSAAGASSRQQQEALTQQPAPSGLMPFQQQEDGRGDKHTASQLQHEEASGSQADNSGRRLPNSDKEQNSLVSELHALLNQLEEASRRAGNESAAPALLRQQQQTLLAAIRDKLAQTETMVLGAQGGNVQSQATDGAACAGRANAMRYSTPNLLLSSNLEQILRQRDRRDEDNQQQYRQLDKEAEEPPEAVEAWFLSRSPAGGRSAGSMLQAAGDKKSNSAGNQRLFRQQSGSKSASRESLQQRNLVARFAHHNQQQQAAAGDQKGSYLKRGQSELDSHLGSSGQQQQPAAAEVAASSESANTKREHDEGAPQRDHWCQSASSSSAHANEFAGAATSRHSLGSTSSHASDSSASSSSNVAVLSTSADPNRRQQVERAGAEEALDGEQVGRINSCSGGAKELTASTSDERHQQQVSAACASDPISEPMTSANLLLLNQASCSTSTVHDKSMAQARYLYCTLTSNAGALLAATATTASKAPLSPSPTRSHAMQRKQAQFVDRQQREAREKTAEGPESDPNLGAGQGGQDALTASGSSSGATTEVSPTSGLFFPTKISKHQGEEIKTRSSKLRTTNRDGFDSGDGSNSSSSSSDADDNDEPEPELESELGPLPELPQSRKSSSVLGRRFSRGDDEEPANDFNPDDPLSGGRASEMGQQTPSIVESQYQEQARRPSRASSTSRSNSISFEAPTTTTTTTSTKTQKQKHQQQLSLTSPAMDPAMHALWAQGADLDTGNGNFIVATRRRRSVHAVHQVQLHQQHQQQHLQQLNQSRNVLGSQPSGGQDTRCYKIEERSPGDSESASSVAGSRSDMTNAPLGQPDQQSALRAELRRLVPTCSVEEPPAAIGSSIRLSGSSHPSPGGRFISASSTKSKSASSFVASTLNRSQLSTQTSVCPQMFDEAGPEKGTAPASLIEEDSSLASRWSKQGTLAELAPEGAEADDLEQELLELGPLGAGFDGSVAPGYSSSSEQRLYLLPDAEYDLDELESNSSLLANLYDWNYPIFELSDCYGHSILSKLSYRIFFDSGFFESFKIPKQAFFNFFHSLEEGYHHKPYHNRLHAADVLHAVYYLTSQPIDNFCQVPLNLIEHYDNLLASTKRLPSELSESVMKFNSIPKNNLLSVEASEADLSEPEVEGAGASSEEFVSKLHNHIVAVVVAAAAAAADSELPFGIMGANLTALEVMALYTSAAMHDFQHPGRTNSFLVATNSPLALLYNDRSVLENHHSAAAWALFYSGPNFNWLCNLEKDEFKRFRFMVIELILATDLMRHYELVSAFNKKLSDVGRHNIDWFCESDRLLVMEIIIKLADVNGPMKGHQLHCQWTDRIAMEFYEQGDEERALNLPVSLYMDRSDPRLPELQKSFINHLVGPLSHSYAAAGFFPKSSALQQEQEQEREQLPTLSRSKMNMNSLEGDDESVYKQTKYWLIEEPKEDEQEGKEDPTSAGVELRCLPDGSSPLPAAANQSSNNETTVSKRPKLNRQFLRCLQTLNLRSNFLYWDAKSKEPKQQQQQQEETVTISDRDK